MTVDDLKFILQLIKETDFSKGEGEVVCMLVFLLYPLDGMQLMRLIVM